MFERKLPLKTMSSFLASQDALKVEDEEDEEDEEDKKKRKKL